MNKFVFGILLSLLPILSGISAGATVIVKPTIGGGLNIGDAELGIVAYSEGWQGMSVHGSWKELNAEEMRFEVGQNGVCYFAGVSHFDREKDAVVGSVELRCTKEVKMQSLSLALQMPLSAHRGMPWKADDRAYTIPTGHSVSGMLTKCTVPQNAQQQLTITFEQPTYFLEQDLSQWTDAWALRFGDTQSPRTIREGETLTFRFRLTSTDGLTLKPLIERTEITEGEQWIRLHNHKNITAGSALDFSHQHLQDGPAGKHGWLKAVDGRFEFERKPGKAVRFYGVNLCFSANYPTHAEADMLVERLVMTGYNTIRIHHHDDTWAKADAEMTDRLDYLLSCAMKRGLYITTDMFVSRKVAWRSIGVDRDGNVGMDLFKSLVGCYEPAFENWCQFARQFMEHVNPYTKRAYKDEPGMPLISLVNEGALFMGFGSKVNEPLIQQAYRDFSGKDEPLVYGSKGFNAFAEWLEHRIAEKGIRFMRSLGCKALLTNDNNGSQHGEGEMATPLYDYVDNHFYVDHPSFLDVNWQLPSRCDNTNPVGYGGPSMFKKGYARGFSKPYTITEWNFSGPGRYRGLGGILTGALAAVQEWDGLWRFAYAHSSEALSDNPDHYPGYFDVSTDPLSQASDRASICLFLRGDAQDERALTMEERSGVLKLETDRTCGIFAPDGRHQAGVLTVEVTGAPATVCLSATDGRNLAVSRRMLLSHITDVQGDGTVYADAERKVLLQWGHGTLLEAGKALIHIALQRPNGYKVYELDTSGNRVVQLPSHVEADGLSFVVSTCNSQHEGRIYYEIVR